jgi:hypothetical protein
MVGRFLGEFLTLMGCHGQVDCSLATLQKSLQNVLLKAVCFRLFAK